MLVVATKNGKTQNAYFNLRASTTVVDIDTDGLWIGGSTKFDDVYESGSFVVTDVDDAEYLISQLQSYVQEVRSANVDKVADMCIEEMDFSHYM